MGKILVTGGLGYIGSHTVVELLNANFEVVIIDNCSNSNHEVLNRIEKITQKRPIFHEFDILNEFKLESVFQKYCIDAVLHFAGFKSVGESVTSPLDYYHNNVSSTIALCNVMQRFDVKKIVFSSSATVYGNDNLPPLTEEMDLSATSPYGSTKIMNEIILEDIHKSDSEWSMVMLRYFNPIGAHESGLIGEDPLDIPNNLMPYITRVAIGKSASLRIFGDNYDTADGTGVRDYIHVVDLAKGHLAALNYITDHSDFQTINLGTGVGFSVLEIVKAFSNATDMKVPYQVVERRPGDVATSFAKVSKAYELLNWKATKSLDDMCRDSWNWQKNNPNGYND